MTPMTATLGRSLGQGGLSFGHLPELDVHTDPLVRQIVGAR